jgi:hypothetical protein
LNPAIPVEYGEAGRWLRGFATAHAKREGARLEASVETDDGPQGRAFGLRLVLGSATWPPVGEPPITLTHAEVGEGRTRFAWCEALAQRIRADARRLLGPTPHLA